MSRATNAVTTRKRRKKILKNAKGYFGNKSRLYRYAKDAVSRAGLFAYRDRRKKKSTMRQLWIVRINAACRDSKINYSKFIHNLKKMNIQLNRKSLSEMAINEKDAFQILIEKVKKI